MIKRNTSLKKSTNHDELNFNSSDGIRYSKNNYLSQPATANKYQKNSNISSSLNERLQFFDAKPSTPSPSSHFKSNSITSDLSVLSNSKYNSSVTSTITRHQSQLSRSNELLSFEKELNSLVLSTKINQQQKNAIMETLTAVFDLFQTPVLLNNDSSKLTPSKSKNKLNSNQITLIDGASLPLYNRMQLLVTSITSLVMNLSDDTINLESTLSNNSSQLQIDNYNTSFGQGSNHNAQAFRNEGYFNPSVNNLLTPEKYKYDLESDEEFDDDDNENSKDNEKETQSTRSTNKFNYLNTPPTIRSKISYLNDSQLRRRSIDYSNLPQIPNYDKTSRIRSSTLTNTNHNNDNNFGNFNNFNNLSNNDNNNNSNNNNNNNSSNNYNTFNGTSANDFNNRNFTKNNDRPHSLYSLRNLSTPSIISRNSPNFHRQPQQTYQNHHQSHSMNYRNLGYQQEEEFPSLNRNRSLNSQHGQRHSLRY